MSSHDRPVAGAYDVRPARWPVSAAGEANPEQRSQRAGMPAPRIVLLSPYWGGNLGDAAILQTTLDALRLREPAAEFEAVTMRPENTQRIHNVDGMQMVAFRRQFYSGGLRPQLAAARAPQNGNGSYLKRRIARWWPGAYALARAAWGAVENVVSETLHWLKAARFLKRFDVLVIAGGGQLDEEWGGAWGHPYALFKWTVIAKLLQLPVVFLSVGVCKLESRTGRYLAKKALRRADYASVRDPWSRNFALSTLGTHTHQAPDLAFGLASACSQNDAPTVCGRFLNVGVSPIAYGRPCVWPTAREADSANYLVQLTHFVSGLLDAAHTVTLFHTDGPDRLIAEQMFATLTADLSKSAISRLKYDRTDSLGELMLVLQSLDAVVASRLHGVILSHALSIPAIAISYDRKVATHMQQMGQAQFCVDLRGLSVAELSARFALLQSTLYETRTQITATTKSWRAEVATQFDYLLSLIEQSRHQPMRRAA